jgi:hypothetical protein
MATTHDKATTTGQTRRNGSSSRGSGAPATEGTSVLFDALAESAEALFSASKSSTERAHRLSQTALADMQAAQQDAIRLARRWAEAPLDLLGWYTAIIETAVQTQQRTAESARKLWDELAQAREETREAITTSARAQWRAGQAAFGLARRAISKS